MTGAAAAIANAIPHRVLASKKGIEAIAKALCSAHPAADARKTRYAWIRLANLQIQSKESYMQFAVRFQSAYCDFADKRPRIALPSIVRDFLGFQMLKGACLTEVQEATALKDAMAWQEAHSQDIDDDIIKEAFALKMKGLLSDGEEDNSAADGSAAPTHQEEQFESVKIEAVQSSKESERNIQGSRRALAAVKMELCNVWPLLPPCHASRAPPAVVSRRCKPHKPP